MLRVLLPFYKDIISHSQWKPGRSILLDHRDLKIDQITASGITEVLDYFKSIGNESSAITRSRPRF